MRPPKALIDRFRSSERIIVTSHIHPEGDAVGSALGLGLILRSFGKEISVVFHHGVPRRFWFLPGTELVRNGTSRCDLLVLVDLSQKDRADLPDQWKNRSCPTIVIDHHPGDDQRTESDVYWVEPNASATGEMVYHLIRSLGGTLTPPIATCLYTAIGADTGFFRYGNTTPAVLRIAARLLEHGVDPWTCAYFTMEERSLSSLRLLSRMLKRARSEGGISWSLLDRDDFQATGTTDEDTEEFINFLRAIEGTQIAVLFRKPEGDTVFVSLRSNGNVDVSQIAKTFGGGGHRAAAGLRLRMPIKKAVSVVLSASRQRLAAQSVNDHP